MQDHCSRVVTTSGFPKFRRALIPISAAALLCAGAAVLAQTPSAVKDAIENAQRNGINNTSFFIGEAEKMLTPEFIEQQGKPDIVITDPPRAGMHEKVVKAILNAAPLKIVYVSCNPATQARDIALMKEQYELIECQPVDMFPHTQHVENIALLGRKIPLIE